MPELPASSKIPVVLAETTLRLTPAAPIAEPVPAATSMPVPLPWALPSGLTPMKFR